MKKIFLFISLVNLLFANVFEEDKLTLTFSNIVVKQQYKCTPEFKNSSDYKQYCLKENDIVDINTLSFVNDNNKGVFNLTTVNAFGHVIHASKYFEKIHIPNRLNLQLILKSITLDYKLVMKDPNGIENTLSEGVLTSIDNDIKVNNEIIFYKYTDTYNVDQYRECIDGESWIKKYGQRSGKKCEWIKLEKKY